MQSGFYSVQRIFLDDYCNFHRIIFSMLALISYLCFPGFNIISWKDKTKFTWRTQCKYWFVKKYPKQDRSHQWSIWPAHSPGRQWLSLDFDVLCRTYGRTYNMCENSDHYRPGLRSASWINSWTLISGKLTFFNPECRYLTSLSM